MPVSCENARKGAAGRAGEPCGGTVRRRVRAVDEAPLRTPAGFATAIVAAGFTTAIAPVGLVLAVFVQASLASTIFVQASFTTAIFVQANDLGIRRI